MKRNPFNVVHNDLANYTSPPNLSLKLGLFANLDFLEDLPT
jgi:hypothetical protein